MRILLTLLVLTFAVPSIANDCFSLFQPTARLRVMTYNLLQFYEGSIKPERRRRLGDMIREVSPDILIVQEVSTLKAVQNLAKTELNNEYEARMFETADANNTAFLVRKSLSMNYTLESHAQERWNEGDLFLRDLPTLVFTNEKGETKLIVVGLHLKSKRNRPGDRESWRLRTAQANRLSEIIQRYQQKYGMDVPIMVGGDFNSPFNHSVEFTALWRSAKMDDAFAYAPGGGTLEERVTHSFFGGGGRGRNKKRKNEHEARPPRRRVVQVRQLDGILVSSSLAQRVLSARVHRYRDPNGNVLPRPKSFHERQENPSDHYPVSVDILFSLD